MANDSGLPAEKATEQGEQAEERYTCGWHVGAFGAEAKQSFNKRSLARSVLAAVDTEINQPRASP